MKWMSCLGVLCVLTTLLAAKDWEDKPFDEWSEKDTASLLQRSPWSKQQMFRQLSTGRSTSGAPRGGTRRRRLSTEDGAPGAGVTEKIYFVTFLSARPVQMALVRWVVLSNTLGSEEAKGLVRENQYPDQVVLSVSLPPGWDLIELDSLSTDVLQETTFLELKKSKKKVPLSRYVAPSESGHPEGLFFFPRRQDGQDLITLQDGEVRFESRFNMQTRLKIKCKLKDMVFDGQLEI